MTCVRPLGWEDPMEKEKTTHSSILAWKIPWTEEPGGLQSRAAKSQTRLKQLNTAHSGASSVSLHRAVLSNFSLDIISSERSFLETVVRGNLQ